MRSRAHGAWVVSTAFVAFGAVAGLGISYLVRPMWEARTVLQCTFWRHGMRRSFRTTP